VADCYEYVNEHSGTTKCGKFVDYWRNSQLIKIDSALFTKDKFGLLLIYVETKASVDCAQIWGKIKNAFEIYESCVYQQYCKRSVLAKSGPQAGFRRTLKTTNWSMIIFFGLKLAQKIKSQESFCH